MKAAAIISMTTMSGAMLLATSCVHVATDPIEVKPIHITLDVNIRIQKDLDNFFAFEEDVLKNPGGVKTSAPPALTPAPVSNEPK